MSYGSSTWKATISAPGRRENVFAIRTPVAIAIGVLDGPPQPGTPASVWKTRLTGSEQEKLAALDSVASLGDLGWQECSREWSAPFYPAGPVHSRTGRRSRTCSHGSSLV